jgi:hypothetical protein
MLPLPAADTALRRRDSMSMLSNICYLYPPLTRHCVDEIACLCRTEHDKLSMYVATTSNCQHTTLEAVAEDLILLLQRQHQKSFLGNVGIESCEETEEHHNHARESTNYDTLQRASITEQATRDLSPLQAN